MNKDSHLIFEAYMSNALKDADGVEIVNPNVRKFDSNFDLDEYLQRILYSYQKYQNPGGNPDKEKFVKAVDSIWTGTHPQALLNLHQELLKIKGGEQGGYNPKKKDFHSYLKDWLQKEALSKVWSKISINSEETPQQYAKDMQKDYAHEMEVKGEREETTNTKRQKDNESRWMSTLSKFFQKEYRREGTDPYLEFFEEYSPHYEDWVIKKFSDMYNQNHASDPESKIDVEHFIKIKNELKDKKDAENIKLQSNSEDEERRLDPKCWKGYHKQGTKMKGGKRVNNCIKNK